MVIDYLKKGGNKTYENQRKQTRIFKIVINKKLFYQLRNNKKKKKKNGHSFKKKQKKLKQ